MEKHRKTKNTICTDNYSTWREKCFNSKRVIFDVSLAVEIKKGFFLFLVVILVNDFGKEKQ